MEILTRRRASRFFAAALVALAGCTLFDLPAGAADRKVVRVATSGDYAPFSFVRSDAAPTSPDLQKLDGFDLEVARRFAAERGYRIEVVRFRWPELGALLGSGGFDVAMSGITVRTERSLAGRYSVPVARTHAVALTWKGSGCEQKVELDRPARRIAVNAGGHLEQVAREAFPNAEIVAIADNAAVRMARLDRSFDAVVSDNFEQRIWTGGDAASVAIGPLSDDRKAYLLPPDRAALAAELDRFLIEREKDGTLAKLRTQWFGETAGTATAEPVAALASAVAERLALMPLVFEAKRHAGKPIEDKAQETAVLDAALQAVDQAAAAQHAAAPDRDAARRLFAVLIEMGKDEQQRLLEREGKSRPGVVLSADKEPAAPAAATGPAGAAPAAGKPADASKPDATPPATRRLYDLGNELRPAIGRITEKIARLLLEIDRPLAAKEVRKIVDAALAGRGIRSERLQELTDAIVALSAQRKAAAG